MRTAWLLPLLNTFAVFIVAPWSICTYARIYMPVASVNGLRSAEADGSKCTQAAKPSTIPAWPQYPTVDPTDGLLASVESVRAAPMLPHRNQRNLSQGQPVSG